VYRQGEGMSASDWNEPQRRRLHLAARGMAPGATPASAMRLVIARGVASTGIGPAIGAAGAWGWRSWRARCRLSTARVSIPSW